MGGSEWLLCATLQAPAAARCSSCFCLRPDIAFSPFAWLWWRVIFPPCKHASACRVLPGADRRRAAGPHLEPMCVRTSAAVNQRKSNQSLGNLSEEQKCVFLQICRLVFCHPVRKPRFCFLPSQETDVVSWNLCHFLHNPLKQNKIPFRSTRGIKPASPLCNCLDPDALWKPVTASFEAQITQVSSLWGHF